MLQVFAVQLQQVIFDIKEALYAFTVLDAVAVLPCYNHFITHVLVDLTFVVQYRIGDVGKDVFQKGMIFFISQPFCNGGGRVQVRNMKILSSSRGVLYFPRMIFQNTPCPNLLLIWRNSCVTVTMMPHTRQFLAILVHSEGMLNRRSRILTIAITTRKAPATARIVYP